MHPDLVSVIIPCFNHATFLEETVTSVLNSTYQPIEIVIVNDGSIDESEHIALRLKNNHNNIKYIFQENRGPAAARNTGINNSSGKYILPLDADDLISPGYIANAIAVLSNNLEVKLVYCEAEFFGDKNGRWKLPPFSKKLLARENMIFCSALYRKQDWERVGGYSEEMTWGWEDWEFWVSLLKDRGNVIKLPITGFYYRIHKGSRRKSTDKEAKRKTIEVINQKHKEFIYQYLHGPLRINRSWSSFINQLEKIFHI